MTPLARLGVAIPIVQAPMAGVSTPAMAAAVSDVGALGSIGVGATDANGARAMIRAIRDRTAKPFNVNLFVHGTPRADPAREAAWLDALRPLFAAYDVEPPATLAIPYTSFADHDAMLAMLVEEAPPVVSFHFGLPNADRIAALKNAGCLLLATATSPAEAALCVAAGIDMIVAQGWEAGGHRGIFDPAAPDDRLGTMALVRLLTRRLHIPVIAAGGIADGVGIRAALTLGVAAVQLGTAYIACPESAADAGYRAALAGPAADHTVMTAAISGRPARCLANRFTDWASRTDTPIPDYPIAYAAGKALAAAAREAGEFGFGAQWAGQAAPLHQALPAADLTRRLWAEAQGSGAVT